MYMGQKRFLSIMFTHFHLGNHTVSISTYVEYSTRHGQRNNVHMGLVICKQF